MTPSTYNWSGGSEAMLRYGPASGPVILAAMAPFEEANRLRSFMTTVLRLLADRGIASALPDLPGTSDSLIPTEKASLSDWRKAYSAGAEALRFNHPTVHGFAIRGGALLDNNATLASRYHVAPTPGAAIVREMLRTRLAAAKEDGEPFDTTAIDPPGPPIMLAGNLLDRQLIADLAGASQTTTGLRRVARLETDAQPADIKFDAAPLWRRAEPGNDPALAALIADDIAAWIVTCAA